MAKKTTKKTTKKVAKKVAKKNVTRKVVKKATKKLAKKAKNQKSNTTAKLPSKSAKIAELNQIVPEFSLPSSEGKEISLSDLRGKKVVLFFYPKDSTPGCTIESQQFSGLISSFAKKNTVVYGISRDSLKSHDNFICKYELKVPLLSDADEIACGIFDVIKEKNMYGKTVLGIERSTFVIDEEGKLIKEWRKVTAEGHAAQVLEEI